MLIKIFLSLALPALTWLLMGGPDLVNNSAYLFLFGVVTLHLLVLIWNQWVFRMFRGDAYTYGAVNFALNLISCVYTLLVSAVLFHQFIVFQWIFSNAPINQLSDLPKVFIGLACLGLFFTLVLPVLSARAVSALPQKSERREYETPGQGGI